MRHRSEGVAERQALHFLALPRIGQQDLQFQGAASRTHGDRSNRAAALLRLAATSTSDAALGAFYRGCLHARARRKLSRRLPARIAVLFFNALRRGMSYRDPGADQYEQHITAVSSPTFTAGRNRGLHLASHSGDANQLFLRNRSRCLLKFSNEIPIHRRSPRQLSGDEQPDRDGAKSSLTLSIFGGRSNRSHRESGRPSCNSAANQDRDGIAFFG
jgi:hypothetical protein